MAMALTRTSSSWPLVIQGGMGVAVSSWPLAAAVARAGQLGVVSGTALDTVLARRLQDGDPGGHVRRALEQFPVPELAERVLARYWRPEGRPAGVPYRPMARLVLQQSPRAQELAVLANFVEVWLAKEGHDGLVGVNYLEKVQMATPAAAYGAMLAGVDYVLMGAGVPRDIPHLLDELAQHRAVRLPVAVSGAPEGGHTVDLDPFALLGDHSLSSPAAQPLLARQATAAQPALAGMVPYDRYLYVRLPQAVVVTPNAPQLETYFSVEKGTVWLVAANIGTTAFSGTIGLPSTVLDQVMPGGGGPGAAQSLLGSWRRSGTDSWKLSLRGGNIAVLTIHPKR